MTVLAALPGADYLALAAGLVAWTYCAHYMMTRLIEADWRPGKEKEVER